MKYASPYRQFEKVTDFGNYIGEKQYLTLLGDLFTKDVVYGFSLPIFLSKFAIWKELSWLQWISQNKIQKMNMDR